MIFWDLQKAFARVPWAGSWATLARQGCIEHSKMRARSLHEGMVHEAMVGTVSHQNPVKNEFPMTGGLQQGWVLEPTLFGIYLSTMLKEVPPALENVTLNTRLDENLCNLARFKPQNKT